MFLKKMEKNKMPRSNVVLKKRREVYESVNLVKDLGLPVHPEIIEKHWDALAALRCILEHVSQNSIILDAGGRLNSIFPSWLNSFGYRNVIVMNTEYEKDENIYGEVYIKSDITKVIHIETKYIKGDITKTNFEDESFDAIICTSVIEHGVDEKDFLNECYRILKLGGILFVSTDYWCQKVDALGETAYGHKIFIYDRKELEQFIRFAKWRHLELIPNSVDLDCEDKVVYWKKHCLRYTFVSLCFKKIG